AWHACVLDGHIDAARSVTEPMMAIDIDRQFVGAEVSITMGASDGPGKIRKIGEGKIRLGPRGEINRGAGIIEIIDATLGEARQRGEVHGGIAQSAVLADEIDIQGE